jgi:hypothetical protein
MFNADLNSHPEIQHSSQFKLDVICCQCSPIPSSTLSFVPLTNKRLNRLPQTTQTLESSAATMSWDVGAGSGGDWSGGGSGRNSFNDPTTGDAHEYGGDESADIFGGGGRRQNDGACFNCGEQGHVLRFHL